MAKDGKREMINRAAEPHIEPRVTTKRRNAGPGYERGADMEGAFLADPGRLSLKAIGAAPKTGRSAERDPKED